MARALSTNNLSLWALLAFSGCSQPPPAGEVSKDAVEFAYPAGSPLELAAIETSMKGYKLLVDDKYRDADGRPFPVSNEGGCAESESFYADGRWFHSSCGAIYIEDTGTWNVNRAKVCVQQVAKKIRCRSVWWAADHDHLIMTVNGNPSALNPYRREPLSEARLGD